MQRVIPFMIPTVMLLGALFDNWPYGYFQILRWVTCIFAIVCMLSARNNITKYAFGGIAILFNPLLPIYLTRDIWVVIDVIVAAFFISCGVFAVISERSKEGT